MSRTLLILAAVWLSGDPERASGDLSAEQLAEHVEVISGGFTGGDRAYVRVGDHVFFDERRRGPQLAGLYVVAIHGNKILQQFHYNTYAVPGASEGLARDIDSFPDGTLVIVAAKDEATRLFDRRGQEALKQIGAQTGLLGQPPRGSYLCIGVKGMAPGEAREQYGDKRQQFRGARAAHAANLAPLEEPAPPKISSTSGAHVLHVGIDVFYYIPQNFDPMTAEYLVCIHGAGDWHHIGAEANIKRFQSAADNNNLVLIAPAFDCLLNWPFNRKKDYRNHKFTDPKIIKDWHYHDFIALLNRHTDKRSDLKVLEVFRLFNDQLMKRDQFHLYGHSGGAQFVNRFVTFHPELVGKVALSAAGSFTFPQRSKDYPWGLRTTKLKKFFGEQIDTSGIRLSSSELDEKLGRLLDRQLFIIVGEEDPTVVNTDCPWQGSNTLERSRNYVEAMRDEHQRQVRRGMRPLDDPFRFELHVLPGVGHDSATGASKAIELLFPSEEKKP